LDLKYTSAKNKVNKKAATESSSRKSFECEVKDYDNKMWCQSEPEEKRKDVGLVQKLKKLGKVVVALLLVVIFIRMILNGFHIGDVNISIGNIDTNISIGNIDTNISMNENIVD